VPDYAAVNEAVEFIKKLQGQKPADLTNAILRNIIRSKNAIRYPDPEEDLIGYISAFHSHPSWLVKRYLSRFGREATEKLFVANNEKPFLTLKMNLLKVQHEEFKSLLNSVNLKYVQGKYLSDFFKLLNLTNITAWEHYNHGYFDVQDESAGLACNLLDVKPRMRVLDMCAAPGGKTSYIAGLMRDQGEIVALDRYESRLQILTKNIKRLGLKSIRPLVMNAMEYNRKDFDRILLDAPCSGTGTFSKKPDIKWKATLLDIKKLSDIQFDLLSKAATMIKTSGILVYSTCSIEPEENFNVIKKFLQSSSNLKLINASENLPAELVDENGCVSTYPHVHQMDGAFAAKLIRIN
jgi:16S rRNA (cytosine967-C5)-methyltransferase